VEVFLIIGNSVCLAIIAWWAIKHCKKSVTTWDRFETIENRIASLEAFNSYKAAQILGSEKYTPIKKKKGKPSSPG
jgi:hypothetical protein